MKWMARAIATDWRWPPDSFDHRLLEAAEIGVEPVHHLAAFGLHRDVIQRAICRLEFATEIEVGRGVDVVGERQRLVDRLDAVFLGVSRVVDVGLLASDVDVAMVALVGAGQDLDEGGFARAIVAEQTDDLAREKVYGGAIDSPNATKGDGDVAHFDERCRHDPEPYLTRRE